MSLSKIVEKAPQLLHQIPFDNDNYNLSDELNKCKGLLFLSFYRLGCIVTIRYGNGLLIRKNNKNKYNWSTPIAFQIGSAELGASIGVEKVDFVGFLKSDKQIESIILNSFTTGISGDICFATIGRSAEIFLKNGGGSFKAYNSSKGIYGGVSLSFGGLQVNHIANTAYYGSNISPFDLMQGNIPYPIDDPVFERLINTLNLIILKQDERLLSTSEHIESDTTIKSLEQQQLNDQNEQPIVNTKQLQTDNNQLLIKDNPVNDNDDIKIIRNNESAIKRSSKNIHNIVEMDKIFDESKVNNDEQLVL